MDVGRSSTPAVADAPPSTSGGQADELTQTLASATDDQQATTSMAALSADEQHRRLVDQWRAELGGKYSLVCSAFDGLQIYKYRLASILNSLLHYLRTCDSR